MPDKSFDKLYQGVPQAQKEQLLRFRDGHPLKGLAVDGFLWRYLAGGQGGEALLLLPGAIGIAETYFKHIGELESHYRVIAPSYPPGPGTMTQLVQGVSAILDAEGIGRAHVLGSSMGGWLAQCLVREQSDRVGKLILAHTSSPEPKRGRYFRWQVTIWALMPIGLIRALLPPALLRGLGVAEEERAFWKAYLKEMCISDAIKAQNLTVFRCSADYLQNRRFTPGDLAERADSILIMESSQDAIFPQADRDALKALYPQAQVYTFQGAGHGAAFSRQAEYQSVVRAFLAGEAAG